MSTSFGTKTIAILLLASSTALAGWKSGTTLPDLNAFKLEGTVPPLSGKVVLLDFWASWCAPCKASFPALDEIHKTYAARGLIVVAVNQDKSGSIMKAFLDEHPVSFTTVRDTENTLVAAADATSMPSSYLVDPSGKVRFIHNGFHGEKTLAQYRREIEQLLNEKAGPLK